MQESGEGYKGGSAASSRKKVAGRSPMEYAQLREANPVATSEDSAQSGVTSVSGWADIWCMAALILAVRRPRLQRGSSG